MRGIAIILLIVPLRAQKTADACVSCHAAESTQFKTHFHSAKGLHCDACHTEDASHSTAATTRSNGMYSSDRIPALCGKCHPQELEEYKGSNHGKLVLAHAKDPAPNCVTCHGAHQVQSASVTEQKCLDCHPALPNFFLNTAPRRIARIACVDCHSVHAE